MPDPLELELQVTVSYLVEVLGRTKLWSSKKTVFSLNH